jgi:y4mF family transcriptional regulator
VAEQGFTDRDNFVLRTSLQRVYFPIGKTMNRRALTPADIGDLVKRTRKAAGLRQDELAGAAGVGLRFIVDLEAGKPTAQLGKVLEVLAALGCTTTITPPSSPGADVPR